MRSGCPPRRLLQGSIGQLFKRLAGRPRHEVRHSHASFSYRATTWDRPHRVVTKVDWHPANYICVLAS